MSANVERSAGRPLPGAVPLVDAMDRAIGRALEVLCATLVAIETLILLAGVVARYVLHAPLVWSD